MVLLLKLLLLLLKLLLLLQELLLLLLKELLRRDGRLEKLLRLNELPLGHLGWWIRLLLLK